MHFVRREEQRLAIVRQLRARHFPLAARQRLRRGRRRASRRASRGASSRLSPTGRANALVVRQPRDARAAAAEPAAAAAADRLPRESTRRRAGQSSTVALPVAGSTVTNQRSLLSCERTATIVVARRRPTRRAALQSSIRGTSASDGLGLALDAGERRGVGPDGLVRLQVEDRQQAASLHVADVRAAGNHLRIRRRGDVVRARPGARGAFGPLVDADPRRNLLVGRQLQVGERLARRRAGSARSAVGRRRRRRRRRLGRRVRRPPPPPPRPSACRLRYSIRLRSSSRR